MATEIKTFSDFKFNKQLLNAIEDMGFSKPSPIQEKAIPRILAGQDLFGIAQTGTGKTAAFVLPILMKIKYAQGNDPRALILAPTRELVIQIDREIHELAKYTDLRHVCVYGGIGPKTQIEEIQKGVDILVGTPGRMMDIYLKGELIFKHLQVMVLDEADRMMDMGFMPQIRKFLEIIPRKRQNLLFSATLPDKVVTLSEEFLEFPERIEVTPQATPAKLVEQKLYYVPNFLTKINLVGELLKNEEIFSRVIIFTKSKENADNIYKFLSRKGKGETKVLHANKGQNSRINAIDSFKDGTVRTLVATDVASRGIDVSSVTHVINFDVPIIYEDYVHRIGRTGRANNTGIALTLCNPAEKYHIEKIQKVIRMQIPVEGLPSDLEILPTPVEERQKINKEIDHQKRRENPDFKGAFHEKKVRKKDSPYLIALNKKKKSGNRRNKKRR
ncbi:MAG: DEAD/DEAH box helicase [Flammeovirgaceae bacterium]|nr:DEAD/DEAH box helicase [Flammeovirgaceae bacterium]